MYNSDSFILFSPNDKVIKIININGTCTHIIKHYTCTITKKNSSLIISQSSEAKQFELKFYSPGDAIIAHDKLRETIKLLEQNNSTGQDNKIRVINLSPLLCGLLLDYTINENDIVVAINSFFSNYSIEILETEIVIFNIPINFLTDMTDMTSFKFSQTRQYLFTKGKGIYGNSIIFDYLELINTTKAYKFIDLYDIDLTNQAGKILTVNANENSINFNNIEDIISSVGLNTETVIDLTDNNYMKIVLNSKIIITGIDVYNGDITNLTINGTTPIFPLTLLNPPIDLEFLNNKSCIFNLKYITYLI